MLLDVDDADDETGTNAVDKLILTMRLMLVTMIHAAAKAITAGDEIDAVSQW